MKKIILFLTIFTLISCKENKESSLKEFYSFLNKSFILIEPGVNPRKWIHNCNRDLSALITEYIDDESEWLTHM